MKKNGKKSKDRLFNSKNVVFTSGEVKETCFDRPWTISRKHTGDVVGTLTIAEPDEFEITESIYDFTGELNVDEYTEIIRAVNDCIIHSRFENVSYIKINAEDINTDIEEALWRLEFKVDPIDRQYMLWECPVDRYMELYLCLGMAMGAAVGGAVGNIGISMSIGMVLGVALGSAMDSSHKKTRDSLYQKRVDAASKRD
ncbi:MAG: glycine zipper family protein [Lachnospiraceae bacterium]|nr:glycine zipper family protein [Lachnospiraceae bacterium]